MSSCSVQYCCSILTETGICQQIFAKFYTIKLVEISCVVIQLFHLYRQTDRQSIFKILGMHLQGELHCLHQTLQFSVEKPIFFSTIMNSNASEQLPTIQLFSNSYKSLMFFKCLFSYNVYLYMNIYYMYFIHVCVMFIHLHRNK